MNDLNQVTLTGRLGADPEVRRTQDGRAIVNIRLAVGQQWRDRESGEKREKTTWVPVVVFSDGLAKVAEQYLRKGSRVLVQGAFSVRDWQDQQGQKRYATEVVLQGFDAKLIMLDRPGEADDGREAAPRQEARQSSRGRQPAPQSDFGDGDMSDDIPF